MGGMYEGFQLLQGAVPSASSPVYQTFKNRWTELNQQNSTTYMIDGGAPILYAAQGYDCGMLMMTGFDQLLKQSPSYTPSMLSDGTLANRLNYTAFTGTGYAGLSWNPLDLNKYGDIAIPYLFYSLNTTNWAAFNKFDDSYAFARTSLGADQYNVLGTPHFYGGGSTPPPDATLYYENVTIEMWSTPAYVLWALLFVGLLIALATMIFSIVQASRTKGASGTLFNLLALFGIMISLVSFPFYIGEMSVVNCQAQLYLPFVGFGVLFGAILAKSAFVLKNTKNMLERQRG
ncbi:hypothetical protein HK101_006362, partial [Irineochytrium annulatum]